MAEVIEFPSNAAPAVVQSSAEAVKCGIAKLQTNEIIRRGRVVLDGLESNLVALDRVGHLIWEDGWHDLIAALGAGRKIALLQASADKPFGPKYRKAIGVWLRCYSFDRIGAADRSRLLTCFDNLEEINTWRSALPAEQRAKLNHPRTVLARWRHWRKSQLEAETQNPPGLNVPSLTVEAVLAWLPTASVTDRRRIAAALAQDTTAMRKILPAKSLPKQATDEQVFEKAMKLMAPAEAPPPETSVH